MAAVFPRSEMPMAILALFYMISMHIASIYGKTTIIIAYLSSGRLRYLFRKSLKGPANLGTVSGKKTSKLLIITVATLSVLSPPAI